MFFKILLFLVIHIIWIFAFFFILKSKWISEMLTAFEKKFFLEGYAIQLLYGPFNFLLFF